MTTEYLSKEMKFFIYLLERYAESRDTTADALCWNSGMSWAWQS